VVVKMGGIKRLIEEPSERTQIVTRIKVHERFNPVTFANNIAILYIEKISDCVSE
jgi:hypothetical protein